MKARLKWNFKVWFWSLLLRVLPVLVLLVFIGLISPTISAPDVFNVPALTSPVVDNGGFLTEDARQQLIQSLQELKRQGDGSEIAVLTVHNLGGLSIEQASIKVTDVWKLGQADKDNGVLLMFVKDERSIRIEVGQGFEGLLTDAHSKRIIDETITPLFRSGNFDQGILLAVYEVAKYTHPDLDLGKIFDRESNQKSLETSDGGRFEYLFPIIILTLIIAGRIGRRRSGRGRSNGWWGFVIGILLDSMLASRSGRSGFDGGRNSGSGGGFGGGGGFSGGGASGKW